MNLNKQFINLAGALVVVIVLVAGVVLIALPLFSQSQAITAQARTVQQSNAVYQTQIDRLSAEQDRMTEIDADVASLRSQIAATPQLDDVFEIIDGAADETESTIESIAAADPETFLARPSVTDPAGLGQPVSPEADAPKAAASASTDDTSSGDGSGDASTDGAATTTSTEPTPDGAASGPQQQIPLTIVVTVKDAEAAADFVDELRVGPRLVLPINSALSDGKLTVQILAFMRTDD